MKAFHTKDLALVKHVAIVSDYTVTALNPEEPILIRDLSIFGKNVYLETPRRQFYCQHCQRYFTERLTFADWERRYTQRYEEYIYERVQSTSIEQVRQGYFIIIFDILCIHENAPFQISGII